MGGPDPGDHLGGLAHSLFLDRRNTAKRLGFWALFSRDGRYLHDPDSLFNASRGSLLLTFLFHLPGEHPCVA